MALTKISTAMISQDAASVDLNIDAGTLYIDSTNNRVGVGTTSPSYPLDVQSGGVGTVLRAGTSFISIDPTGSASAPSLIFNGDDNTGIWHPAADTLAVATGGSERMRIDSSGNLLVGATTTTNLSDGTGNDGVQLNPSGTIAAARTSNVTAVFNRLSTDGQIARFNKDGTTVGSIGADYTGTSAAGLFIGNGTNGLFFNGSADVIQPYSITGGENVDNTIDLGNSAKRFKNLYLSGGLRGDTIFSNSAGTTEYARFDSSGNLLVGTTSATMHSTSTETGTQIADGTVNVSANNPVAQLNRIITDGAIVNFRKDGTVVGSIGNNTDFYIASQDGTGVRFTSTQVLPCSETGATQNTSRSLGSSTAQWADLYMAGTLYGPSTFTIDPATHGDDTGTVVIKGNLQIDGTTTTINSTTVTVDDLLLTLASGAANAAAADGAGIEVDITGATNPSITYDGTNDEWDFNKGIKVEKSTNALHQIVISNPSTGVSARADVAVESDSADIRLVATSGAYTGVSGWADSGIITTSSATSGGILFNVQGSYPYRFMQSATNERMRIHTNGNVGIGETSPSSKLQVSGPASSSLPLVNITNTSNTTVTSYGLSVQGGGNSGSSGYQFQTKDLSGNVDFFIRGDGNIGIGTTSPNQLLHLSAAGPVLAIGSTSINDPRIDFYDQSATTIAASLFFDQDADTLRILRTASGSAVDGIAINDSGKVGIGTTSPADVLHLNGAANASTGITIGNNNSTRLRLYHNDAAGSSYLTTDGMQTEQRLYILSGSDLRLGSDGTERLRIASGNDYVFLGHTGHSWGTFHDLLQIGRTGAIAVYDNGANQQTVIANNTYYGASGYTSIEGTTGSSYMNLSQGAIRFYTAPSITAGSAQTFTQRLRITNGGNVGIGEDNPAGPLHVTSTGITSYFEGTAGNVSIQLLRSDASGSVDFGDIQFANSTGIAARINSRGEGGSASGNLTFQTRNTSGTLAERMRITSAGNIGIGTDSPDEKLHISGGGIKVDGEPTIATNSGAGLFFGYGSNVAKITALDQGVAWKNLRLNAAEHEFYIAGGQQAKLDSSGNLLLGAATANDSSLSMGGQTPDLYVPGYTSLGGLRIKGTDTGNTIYKTGGAFGLTLGDSNMITLSNSDSTARLNTANWEVLGGGQLRAYRSGNSAYGALFMDTAENLYIRNSWGMKDLVFDRDGNLGINNNNPNAKLNININDSGDTSAQLLQQWQHNSQNTLQLNMYGGATDLVQFAAYNGEQNIAIVTEALASLSATTSKGIYIKSGGNVGIGTTNPAYQKLDVNGEIRSTTMILGDSAAGNVAQNSQLHIKTGGTPRIMLEDSTSSNLTIGIDVIEGTGFTIRDYGTSPNNSPVTRLRIDTAGRIRTYDSERNGENFGTGGARALYSASNSSFGKYEVVLAAEFTAGQGKYIRIQQDSNIQAGLRIHASGNYSNVDANGSFEKAYTIAANAINTNLFGGGTASSTITDLGSTSSKLSIGTMTKPNSTTIYIPVENLDNTYAIIFHFVITIMGEIAGITSVDMINQ